MMTRKDNIGKKWGLQSFRSPFYYIFEWGYLQKIMGIQSFWYLQNNLGAGVVNKNARKLSHMFDNHRIKNARELQSIDIIAHIIV